MPGKKKEGTAGGVSGGGSFLWTRRGAWCLVFGKEHRRSWRGSLVSGEGVGSFLGTPRQEIYTWEKVKVLRVGGFCV